MVSLADSLWHRNRVLAEAALEHTFVQGIASGELARATFAYYVGQDAAFLDAFSRAYALALAKSPDQDGLIAFRELLDAAADELCLHRGYADRWDVDLHQAADPATVAYANFSGVLLELVTDGAQQVVPVGHVAIGLHPEGRLSVDDAHNATATWGHRDQDVDRIGCGAVDRADLGHRLNRVEDVDREPVTQEDHEAVPGGNGQRIAGRELDQFRIIAGAANQPWPGGLAKGQPEPQRRAHSHHRLMQVLDRLDEVRLPDHDIDIVRLVDGHHIPGKRRRGHKHHAATRTRQLRPMLGMRTVLFAGAAFALRGSAYGP